MQVMKTLLVMHHFNLFYDDLWRCDGIYCQVRNDDWWPQEAVFVNQIMPKEGFAFKGICVLVDSVSYTGRYLICSDTYFVKIV